MNVPVNTHIMFFQIFQQCLFKKHPGVSEIQSPKKKTPAGLRYFASGNDDGLHAVYPNIKLCSLSVQKFTVPQPGGWLVLGPGNLRFS